MLARLPERWRPWAVAGSLVLLWGVITLLRSVGLIGSYWGRIIDLSLITTTAALGLSIIYGLTGQFSLGHAAFYGLGAYTAGVLSKGVGSGSLPIFLLALLSGTLAAAVMAVLVGLPILRLRSDYLGIATLGLGIILRTVVDNSDRYFAMMGGSRGMLGVPQVTNFHWLFFFFCLAIVVTRNVKYSAVGRRLMAIREDEIAAEAMGVHPGATKTLAFALGCGMAGLAGSLYAHFDPFLHPSLFDFLKSFDYLLIVVLGGLGSITGTVVTAVAWVFIFEVLRLILPQELLDWRLVFYALILIVTMILRPQGLFGQAELSLWPRRAAAKGGQPDAQA